MGITPQPATHLDKITDMIRFEKKQILNQGGFFMALVKWDPFRDVAELQHRINRMFDESFGRSRR